MTSRRYAIQEAHKIDNILSNENRMQNLHKANANFSM